MAAKLTPVAILIVALIALLFTSLFATISFIYSRRYWRILRRQKPHGKPSAEAGSTPKDKTRASHSDPSQSCCGLANVFGRKNGKGGSIRLSPSQPMVCGSRKSDAGNVVTVMLTPPSPAKSEKGVSAASSSAAIVEARDIEEAVSTHSDAESSQQSTDPV